MNNASLELGGTNWAEKDGNILGYSVGDTSGKFSPQEFTFARGSNLSATRINKAGLIEKGRENFLLQSNQFDTTWSPTSLSVTSGATDPNGGSTAWTIANTAASGITQQAVSLTGLRSVSIYAKQGTHQYLRLGVYGGTESYANFDLQNGVVSSGTQAVIESVDGGWYRCTAWGANGTTGGVQIFPSNNATSAATTNGSISVWHSQLEQGLAASPYIETTSTTAAAGVLENTPRLNYTTGVANPYLLLEPSRTNLVNSSEYPTSVGGSGNVRLIGGATATYNYGISPEGLQNSTLVLGSNGNIGLQVNFTSSAVNQDWSYSFYIKGTAGETVNLRFELNPYYNNGSQFVTFTGGWQRVEQKISYDATAHTSKNIYITFLNASTATQFEIYGVQAEANASYSTSYIPTYGISQTRADDNCSKTNASDVIGQTEGTIYANVDLNHTSVTNNYILQVLENSGNRVLLYKENGTNKIGCFAIIGSTTIYSQRTSGAFTGINKIAFAYKSGDFAFYVNGTQIGTSTATFSTSGTFDKLNIDSNTGSENGYFNYNQAALYKERLTNAELATLTTL